MILSVKKAKRLSKKGVEELSEKVWQEIGEDKVVMLFFVGKLLKECEQHIDPKVVK